MRICHWVERGRALQVCLLFFLSHFACDAFPFLDLTSFPYHKQGVTQTVWEVVGERNSITVFGPPPQSVKNHNRGVSWSITCFFEMSFKTRNLFHGGFHHLTLSMTSVCVPVAFGWHCTLFDDFKAFKETLCHTRKQEAQKETELNNPCVILKPLQSPYLMKHI